MQFSKFGTKFIQNSAILQLMDDLGDALKSEQPVNMLGGGNPAVIDAVNDVFAQVLRDLASDSAKAIDNIGNYSNPQGDNGFIQALARFFQRQYGWAITADNIALTNGSQNAFFYLFNLFAGKYNDGSEKNILLPLAPEYIGYSDVQIERQFFSASKPLIQTVTHKGKTGFFKYHIDFDALETHPDLLAGRVGAICCSRPTNPTGNVLSDAEMAHLANIARQYDVPLIIDNAYGLPFPNILFTEASLHWDDNTVLCLSLSKLGLPGVRTGIVIADKPIIKAISALNAIVNLAPTRFGGAIVQPLLENGRLTALSNEVIQPFYARKAEQAIAWLQEAFAGYPVYIHKPEGAIFLWIWFEDLPISTLTLYERLKEKGTIIIPGEHFFPGIDSAEYRHAHECIRLSIAPADTVLRQGIEAIAEMVCALYSAMD